MTNENIADSGIMNAIIVSKLSIERCQAYLAHLHALMHLCDPDNLGCDAVVAESARKIMRTLESELEHSADALGTFE